MSSGLASATTGNESRRSQRSTGVDDGPRVESNGTLLAQRVDPTAPRVAHDLDVAGRLCPRADRPHHVVEAAWIDVAVDDDDDDTGTMANTG